MPGLAYPGQGSTGWSPFNTASVVPPNELTPVSDAFKTAARQPIKGGARSAIEVMNEACTAVEATIYGTDDLASFKIEAVGGMLTTAMRKLTVKLVSTDHDFILRPTYVRVKYGLKLADGTWEDLCYGTFLVTEQSIDHETGNMTFCGYDLMIRSYVDYNSEWHIYPETLSEFLNEVCAAIRVSNGMVGQEFTNSGLYIDIDYYAKISSSKYRDILEDIAEVTGTMVMIGRDDALYLKPIHETTETLDKTTLKKFKAYPLYGPVNSVVLSRMPQEDNIALCSDESGALDAGLVEVKIVNNELVDKRRQETIQSIYNALEGISFYPFDVTTTGLGWYELGDRVTVHNSGQDYGAQGYGEQEYGLQEYSCVIFNYTIEMDGALKERLFTAEQSKTATNYKRAGDITKHLYNTELIVDKQQQYIEGLVSDMYNQDGLVNSNFTQIVQDLSSVVTSVQNAGGNNLIKNSAAYMLDETGLPQNWTTTITGTLSIEPSADAISRGSLSGNIVILNNATMTQRVSVRPDNSDTPDNQKTYYTFAVQVKKGAVGTGSITLSNAVESHVLEFTSGDDPNYDTYSIESLLPLGSYYDVTVTGSADSNFTITDMILAVGKYKSQWQQANGEFANTQVQINVDGVTVRSNKYLGTYTKQTPLAFSGYKDGDLVFSIDVNGLQVKKALVAETIEMKPIKLVKMNGGIAFVPGTED